MTKYFCIYRITNNINGKTYIGQHSYINESDPMKGYAGSGKALRLAYKKYGRENFSTEVLYKRIQYKETADSMEIWMIEKERKENKNGCYNICKGGRSGPPTHIISELQRSRIIESNKRRKGCHLSETTRKKMSESQRGKKRPPRSEEYRRKLSEANKGKHLSEAAKQKLSKFNKGKKISEWQKQRISEAQRKRWIKYREEKENGKQ